MNPAKILKMKRANIKIAALTGYDASFARLLDEAGCDFILIGDSLGMVIQGGPSTHAVTVAEICYHVRCCRAGAPNALLAADLPFGSFELGPKQAFKTAATLIAAGAKMIKIEGGEKYAGTVAMLVERGIPVCGHVGLQPQAAIASGFSLKGRSANAAARIMADARAIADAGACMIVLEMIKAALASEITKEIKAATIGIGAGPGCDGQILVLHDLLGVFPNPPSFAKNFLADASSIQAAVRSYVAAVKDGSFPGSEHIPA